MAENTIEVTVTAKWDPRDVYTVHNRMVEIWNDVDHLGAAVTKVKISRRRKKIAAWRFRGDPIEVKLPPNKPREYTPHPRTLDRLTEVLHRTGNKKMLYDLEEGRLSLYTTISKETRN